MPESFVQVTQGNDLKLRTHQRTINAQDVHESAMQLADPYLPTFTVIGAGISLATVNDHILQIMAGSTLNVLVERIQVFQRDLAGAAATWNWDVRRLTTAGSGGVNRTPVPLDPADSAGFTAMTLPTSKGTEGSAVWPGSNTIQSALNAALSSRLLADIDFERLMGKRLLIPAGTSNGIALKSATAIASATVTVVAAVREVSY